MYLMKMRTNNFFIIILITFDTEIHLKGENDESIHVTQQEAL